MNSVLRKTAGIAAAAMFLAGPLLAQDTEGPLKTVAVASAELPRIYRLDGVAEAVNRSTVSAQTAGRVVEVNFDVDDYVREGDIIVVLEDSEQQAGVRQAEANLKVASVQRQDAEKEYRRVAGVFAKQAVSKADMDRATAARNQAIAAEQAAEATLEQARQQLDYTQIRAPYNGIVTERLIEIGEVAQPGRQLMSGFSVDSMRISVDVPQNLVSSIRAQSAAQVEVENQWIEAEDVTVFPVADPRSDTFEVRLRLPDGVQGVFPGMYVKVGFMSGRQQTLVVPLSAVVLRSEVVGIYVVDGNGRVLFRHVRLGSPAGPEYVTVLSGVDAGEQIAVDPVAAGIRLKSQRKVQVSDE